MTSEHMREGVRKQLDALMASVDKKVKYYSQRTYIEGGDVFYIVREFFLGLCEKTYEASYEELIREIESNNSIVFLSDNQRNRAINFLRELSEAEYSGRGASPEHFKEMLAEFVALARELTSPHDTSIDELIYQGLSHARSDDKDIARKKYRLARDKYESLPENEQQRYYEGLNKLYSSLH